MPRSTYLFALLAVTLCAGSSDVPRTPVLLELFTSEGCSSCPPADRLLQELDRNQPVAGADLIVLSEHVDYWDHLGWKDPFSDARYSARQRDYAERYHADGVYTPELVVDGRFSFVGSDSHAATAAIQKAVAEHKISLSIPEVSRAANQVTAHLDLPADPSAKGLHAFLYLVLADDKQQSQVSRGENAGHSLAHVGVARAFKQLDANDLDRASSKDIAFQIPSGAGANGLRLIAFLQDRKSGHILGVCAHKL